MLAENLRKRRLELGLTQEEVAEKVGYRSRSSIAKLESGNTDVTQKKLRLLADVLSTTPENLIGDRDGADEGRTVKRHQEQSRTIALILAGGKSTRNMLSIPSQFVNVDDKPVIAYVMEAYEKHPQIEEIHVVCLYGWEKTLQSYARQYDIKKLGRIITGGHTILESARLGFESLADQLQENDAVILQEATRPMISTGLISMLLSDYNRFGSSIFCRSMSEFVQIERTKEDTRLCNRNDLFSLESPEIHSAKTLKEFMKRLKKGHLDDGSSCAVAMTRVGIPLHFCEIASNNLKIVKQEDIYIFKVLKQVIL